MTTTVDVGRLSAVLSPKQIASIADNSQTICLLEGSISAGKTLASLWKLFIAVRSAPTNGLIVVVGKTLQTLHRNVFTPMQSRDLFGQLADTVQYTRGSDTAKVMGRTVAVVGANDTRAEGRIRGLTAALIYVDEATLLPAGYWEMLTTRLRVAGARMIATTNPGASNHWLKAYIDRAAEVGMSVWSFRMSDNPSLLPSYVARMESSLTGVFYRRFILGEWTNAEGAIFDMFDAREHVIPWGSLPVMHRLPAAGMDYGTQNAAAAGSLGWGRDRGLYICSEWRHDANAGQSRWTDAQLSAGLRLWLPGPHTPYGAEPQVEWLYVDPSAASMKTQLYYDGLTQVANADNDVVTGIRLVSSLLATGRLKIADRCAALIKEMPSYVWDPKAAERGEDKPLKKDDHSIDGALRYPVASTQALWAPELLGSDS